MSKNIKKTEILTEEGKVAEAILPVELDVNKTVKKSNILNELRNANATLVEYRLFCVYLAHLSLNKDDNVVTFTLADYARIAGLKRPRKEDLEVQSTNLLKMTALIDNPDGGFSNRTIFSDFTLFQDNEWRQWMVSLECNPKIAPLIREQKGRFLRYKLYNTIYLKSFNQQRIYELLKQYEKIGSRTETLEDLRAFLSIGETEYPRWADFGQKVLKVAQRALKEHTDICFEYEPVKKMSKVVAVKFDIFKNEEFIDRLRVEEFAPKQEVAIEYEGEGFHVHNEPELDSEQLTSEASAPPEREMTIKDIQRQARIDITRDIVAKCKFEFTDGDLEQIVVAVEHSIWWDNVQKTIDATTKDKENAFAVYVEDYYVYTKNNSTAGTKNGFIKYLTGGLRTNYNGYPLPAWAEIKDDEDLDPKQDHQGSFDTNEAYVSNLKRTFGDDFDPNLLK